jgi:hypothetical protein
MDIGIGDEGRDLHRILSGDRVLMAFEVLNLSLVFLGSFPRSKRPEILTLVCLRIYFAGVESMFAGFQFSDHIEVLLLDSRRKRMWIRIDNVWTRIFRFSPRHRCGAWLVRVRIGWWKLRI